MLKPPDELEKVFNEAVIPNETVLGSAVLDFCKISNAQGNGPLETTCGNTFECPECKTVFSRQSNLTRHIKTIHSESSNICPFCNFTPKRLDNLKRHLIQAHKIPLDQATAITSPNTFRRVPHSEKENASAICVATDELSDSTRREPLIDFLKKCPKNTIVNVLPRMKTVQKASSVFICSVCGKNYSTITGLIQHLKMHASSGKYNAALNTSTETNLSHVEVSRKVIIL
ncbi:hypothetical protein TNIN_273281 [Trichonephila inaurata madagascariensis]|uniref:C2H2-type domain-containing protein n=1 Tax=Trichonephila inaurata madagascariensis TaxID=2747483 RepID=A0A8X6JZ60_9ARAC|nr:hypothetical protein TNIN_273281 [Trichonephila inaurata madagascariensis]